MVVHPQKSISLTAFKVARDNWAVQAFKAKTTFFDQILESSCLWLLVPKRVGMEASKGCFT